MVLNAALTAIVVNSSDTFFKDKLQTFLSEATFGYRQNARYSCYIEVFPEQKLIVALVLDHFLPNNHPNR
jgi:hypothetical protein